MIRQEPFGKHMRNANQFYQIVLRPVDQFTTFRLHEVGKESHAQQVVGRHDTGAWETHAWFIGKNDAHVQGRILVPDKEEIRKIFSHVSEPVQVRGNIFRARAKK